MSFPVTRYLPRALRWLAMAAFAVTTCASAEEAVVAPAAPVESAPPIIREIRFAGNKVTQPGILLQEMTLTVGDRAYASEIEVSRQAIMDLGLFKSVTAETAPMDDGVSLLITVDEKYYILPIPKLNRDADNNISLGAQLRLDNLGGLNQQFKFTYENERSSLETVQDLIQIWELEYHYPRVLGTANQVDLYVSRRETPTGSVDSAGAPVLYTNTFDYFNLGLGRWLVKQGPTRGWHGGFSLVLQKQAIDVFQGMPSALDGVGVGIGAFFEYTNVRNLLYSRNGREFGWLGEFGAPWLGSDTDYTRHLLYYRAYYPVTNRPHTTINTQVQLGLASDTLFGGLAYSLGGSKSLRGYPAGGLLGNAFMLVNMEWLTPLNRDYLPLLGGVILDIGNTYPSNSELNLSDPKIGAGFALRYKLKSFVKIELRLDYVYNVDTGEWKAYAGTREAF